MFWGREAIQKETEKYDITAQEANKYTILKIHQKDCL